ncbi:MAG: class II fructose-bisphosphate aldolase [Armatimonadota bacterium]|nr:MAG: class II fructose-bisphosphate aldolase [Armatimonadota bacterium]
MAEKREARQEVTPGTGAQAEESLRKLPVAEIMRRACELRIAVPAFNVAYLPMVRPIVEALEASNSFALVEVARPDIERFGAQSYQAVASEFERHADRAHARLHQDHLPVIDEEQRRVEWRPLIEEALELGYDSVMIDGSRLPLAENIAVTKEVVAMAQPRAAVEAELGAVLGHEPGPLPPYEELFASGRGFTDVEEAARLVGETGVDWLSVAVGNVHGAISGAAKDQLKVEARLSIEHLRRLSAKVSAPLVLHGGTGIRLSYVRRAIDNGIAKINVATGLRQPYEASLREDGSTEAAQEAVARAVDQHLKDYRIVGSAGKLAARAPFQDR